MADLLECLIQVRALAETAPRLARFLRLYPEGAWYAAGVGHGRPAAALLASLVVRERGFAAALRAVRADGAEDLEGTFSGASPATLVATFTELRTATLALLARCTAEELARPLPGGGARPSTVADLVAAAVAADTETLAQIRACLEDVAAQRPREGV